MFDRDLRSVGKCTDACGYGRAFGRSRRLCRWETLNRLVDLISLQNDRLLNFLHLLYRFHHLPVLFVLALQFLIRGYARRSLNKS